MTVLAFTVIHLKFRAARMQVPAISMKMRRQMTVLVYFRYTRGWIAMAIATPIRTVTEYVTRKKSLVVKRQMPGITTHGLRTKTAAASLHRIQGARTSQPVTTMRVQALMTALAFTRRLHGSIATEFA